MKQQKPLRGQAVSAVLWWRNPDSQSEEILMTKRHSWMRYFPGYTAFPGGKVDVGETTLMTLSREIQEEVGLELDITKAIFHGIATTPEIHPYRFETHYFSIELTHQLYLEVNRKLTEWDNHPEFVAFEWGSAAEHLLSYQEGNVLMVPLVRHFLQDIAKVGVDKSQMHDVDNLEISKLYYPLEMQSDLVQLFIPSKTLPPQIFTNCFLINANMDQLSQVEQSVLMIDPSPLDLNEWKRMIEIFEKLKIKPEIILCTHHHIDHCSFLHLTAEHFKVPVLMHQSTYDLGEEKNPDVWQKLLPYLKLVKHGEQIGFWKDKPLIISHIPGHAAGHIAVTTPSGDFFIAGDLFQSEGSVVIGGRGSSMSIYMKTLKELVQFAPQVLYPSHGIPLGSILPLIKILKHRLFRHQEVVKLTQQGLNCVQITEILYSDIPRDLFPYAKANVESHLQWFSEQSLEETKEIYKEFW